MPLETKHSHLQCTGYSNPEQLFNNKKGKLVTLGTLLYSLRFYFLPPLDFFNSVFQAMFCRSLLKLFSEGQVLPFWRKAKAPPGEATDCVAFEGASKGWYQDIPSKLRNQQHQIAFVDLGNSSPVLSTLEISLNSHAKEPKWKGRT